MAIALIVWPSYQPQGCNNLVTTLLQPSYRYAIDMVTTLQQPCNNLVNNHVAKLSPGMKKGGGKTVLSDTLDYRYVVEVPHICISRTGKLVACIEPLTSRSIGQLLYHLLLKPN